MFHSRGPQGDIPANTLEGGGLRFVFLGIAETLPLEAASEIRICVPLGPESVYLAMDGLQGPEALLSLGEAGVMRAGSAGSVACFAPTSIALLWLDNEVFLREAQAAVGVHMELTENFVGPDAYLSRVGNVLKAGVRVARPASSGYLASLARDLSAHLASAYGEPRAQARIRGLSPDRLSRSLALIEEKLSEPLRVEELAERVNMSAFHYARMFKSSTGHSPHFYITMRRIERAKQMLSGSGLSLAKISESLGYATQAHFTGVFRMHAGTTPNAYRMRFKPPGSAEP